MRHGLFTAVLVLLAACEPPEDQAREFLEDGKALFAEGTYVKANLQLRNAVQADPSLVEAWYLLSRIAEDRGTWPEVLRFASKTVELDPKHLAARLTLGKLFLASNQIDKALEQSDALIGIEADDASVQALRASVLHRLGDREGALQAAERALELDANNPDAIVVMSTLQLLQGDEETALALVGRGLEARPRNEALHILKIRMLEETERYPAAVIAYETAIELWPENAGLRLALAQLHADNGRSDEAIAIYRHLVAADPEDIDLKLSFARFVYREKGLAAAEELLTVFIEDSPQETRLRFALAAFYAQSQEPGRAGSVYQEIIARNEEAAEALSAKAKMASLAVAQGDEARARELIEEIIEVEPRNREALLIRAALHLQAHETEPAIADLRSVLRDAPRSADALLLLARAHRQKGGDDLANDYYIQVIAAHPERSDIRLEHARFLMQRRDYARAEEVLAALLAFEPDHAAALRAMTDVKLARQDWAGALEYARRLEGGPEGTVFSEQVKGTVHAAQERVDLSIAAFKRAHELSPNAVQPIVSLVRAYMQHGRAAEAKEFLAAVIRAYEGNVTAHVLLGQIAASEENWAEAEEAFSRAIETAPLAPIGYRSMAALQLRNGDFAAAEQVIEQGLLVLPGNLVLRLSLASLYERWKTYDAAIAIYEEMLAENPRIDIAANNLASLLLDHRSDAESHRRALDLAERFRGAEFPYFLDTLGWAHYRQGDFEQALKLFETVVERLPEVAEFRYHLGMAYLALDRAESAKKELETALSLGGDREFTGRGTAEEALKKL